MRVPPSLWSDRRAAGLELAQLLQPWADCGASTTVIGLPRGGIAVAAAVAQELNLPLASWSVRKLARASQPEYALGALAPGGVVLWNPAARAAAELSPEERQQLVAEATSELKRRALRFADPDATALKGRHLIVVDDGIATGMTVRAALQSLRQCEPQQLVLAVPVLDRSLMPQLRPLVDALVSVVAVDGLRAVGAFYDNFEQLSDDAVQTLLHQARPSSRGSA